MGDVYQEVDEVMSNLKVGMHKIKPCSRKYAFELADIPKEADYLKLMYPYNSKRLLRSPCSSTDINNRAPTPDEHAWGDIFPCVRH